MLNSSCLEHLDPSKDRARFAEEQSAANVPVQRLTAKGELPPAGGEAVDGNAVFAQYCASCHGDKGAADSPAALAMNPRPRNLTDKAWQASVDDEHIYKVIKSGGGAVGLSATMPAWGGQLNEAQLRAMVAQVRSYGQ
jgi:mono/diheme cytochrome c family protein